MGAGFLDELIRSRRSIRKFTGDPVDRSQIVNILDTAVYAPSNNNRQGWKFYVITNRELIRSMADIVDEELEAVSCQEGVIGDLMKGYSANFTLFREAPAVVVCCFSKPAGFNFSLFRVTDQNRHFTGELISLAMLMQNILLLAHERGLGSLVMTAPLIGEEGIRRLLRVPGKFNIGGFICLGHPAHQPCAPVRRDVSQVAEFLE